MRARDFSQLKAESADDMILLDRRLAQPEKARLGIIIRKRLAALPYFAALDALWIGCKTAGFFLRRNFAGPVFTYGIWALVCRIHVNAHAVHAVALVVVRRLQGPVDGKLIKIRAAQTVTLRIRV